MGNLLSVYLMLDYYIRKSSIHLSTRTHTHTHTQQVEEWYPELIEVEERAKDSASLLFFVIDSQTRAVSSMVEIAFFAGEGYCFNRTDSYCVACMYKKPL